MEGVTMSKGSKQRPTDQRKYSEGWDRVFGTLEIGVDLAEGESWTTLHRAERELDPDRNCWTCKEDDCTVCPADHADQAEQHVVPMFMTPRFRD